MCPSNLESKTNINISSPLQQNCATLINGIQVQGLIFSMFFGCMRQQGKAPCSCLLQKKCNEVRSEESVWKLEKIAYDTRARDNHTGIGLKNPHRSLPAGFCWRDWDKTDGNYNDHMEPKNNKKQKKQKKGFITKATDVKILLDDNV